VKNKLPQFILLVSVLTIGISTGCQRNFVNQQLPANGFLTKSDDSVEMLFGIGRMAERNGKTDKAIEAFQSILAEHPNHANAMHRMGVIKAKQGLIKESIAWLEKASQLEAPSAELIGDMGYVLYLDGDLPAAKMMLENGLQKNPDDARMTNNLAIVTGVMEQYDESMNLFRQHGTEAEALAAIAYIQTQGGHVDAARQNYLKSLELDGKLEIAANGLIELDRNSTSPESFRPQPLEIEMPSSVQLAAHHNDVTLEQAEMTMEKNETAKVVTIATDIEAEPFDKSAKIPTSVTGNTVMLASAENQTIPKILQPKIVSIKPVADVAEPLPMESLVENTSSELASTVEVELTLDASMGIASVSHEAWMNEQTNSVVWTLDSLAAGETETIDFDAIGNVAGTQTHRLTIKIDGQPVGELSLDTKVE